MKHSRLLSLGTAAALVAFLVRAWPTIPTVVDDAWISARYAMQFGLGNGLVYNAGEPPVEGYTNLAFVLVCGVLYRLGVDMHTALVGVGMSCAAIGLVAATGLTRSLIGRNHPYALVPAGLLAIDMHYAVVASNGIESSMFVAFVLAACWATFDAKGRWRALAATLVGGLCTIRPEGIAVALTLVGYDLVARRSPLRDPSTWALAVGTALFAVPIWVGRRLYFGEWVPNTFAAKNHKDLGEQLAFNLKYLGPDGQFWTVVAIVLVAALLARPSDAKRLTVGAVALGLAFVAFRVDMWMPGGRLLLPTVALALCLAASHLPTARPGWTYGVAAAVLGFALAAPVVLHFGPTVRITTSLYYAAPALLLLIPAGVLAATIRAAPVVPVLVLAAGMLVGPVPSHVRGYDKRHTALPGNGAELAAKHLAAHAPPGAVLATRDAGVFAYHVGPNVNVAELHERALTRPHPDGKNAEFQKYTPKNPEFFVPTLQREEQTALKYGPDRAVFRGLTEPYVYLGRVYQHYHRYYDVYVRADLNVPPLPEDVVVNRKGPKPPKAVETSITGG